jgi:hypothetical protein
MSVFMVVFELSESTIAGKYAPIFSFMESHTHCPVSKSVWFIDTDRTFDDLHDDIARLMVAYPDSVEFIVTNQQPDSWTTRGLRQVANWLKSPDRSWG